MLANYTTLLRRELTTLHRSFWVTVAALPTTLIGIVAAGYAVRHELKWLMFAFNVCLFAALAYFVYQVSLEQHSRGMELTEGQFWRIFGSSQRQIYANDRITLGIFASVSMVLLVLTFLNAIWCQSFFGKADLWQKAKTSGNEDNMPLNEMELDNDYLQNKRLVLD